MCSPMVDGYECSGCGVCVELCPDVFRINELTGKAEPIQVRVGKNDVLLKALAYCPEKCISLEK